MKAAFIGKLKLLYHGQGDWELLDSFTFRRPNGDIVSAPRKMKTDLASIPNKGLLGMFARATIRKLGKHVRSAVIHDAGYQGVADAYGSHGNILTGMYTRADWDAVLGEAMVAEQEGWGKRFIIKKAVRWFGGKHYQKP